MDSSPVYTTCYIAFLDLLGFKRIISSKECADIVQIFSAIKRIKLREVFINVNGQQETLVNQELIQEIKLKIMSDSICFYIDAAKPHAFFLLLATCYVFQSSMAKKEEPILMRGGIVCGKLYVDEDIVFGPGLTEAYLLEEKNAKNPRIIISKETLEEARKKAENEFIDCIDALTFFDQDGYYVLNYFMSFFRDVDKPDAGTIFCDHINTVLSREADPSIKEKYTYLKTHFELFRMWFLACDEAKRWR